MNARVIIINNTTLYLHPPPSVSTVSLHWSPHPQKNIENPRMSTQDSDTLTHIIVHFILPNKLYHDSIWYLIVCHDCRIMLYPAVNITCCCCHCILPYTVQNVYNCPVQTLYSSFKNYSYLLFIFYYISLYFFIYLSHLNCYLHILLAILYFVTEAIWLWFWAV